MCRHIKAFLLFQMKRMALEPGVLIAVVLIWRVAAVGKDWSMLPTVEWRTVGCEVQTSGVDFQQYPITKATGAHLTQNLHSWHLGHFSSNFSLPANMLLLWHSGVFLNLFVFCPLIQFVVRSQLNRKWPQRLWCVMASIPAPCMTLKTNLCPKLGAADCDSSTTRLCVF